MWEESIEKEINNFKVRNTLKVSDNQEGRGMKTKIILQYKYDGQYNLVRKTRMVVCGYSQIKGVDYHDTYSPTTTTYVVFILLYIASANNYFMSSFDVSAAFLEGKADTEMYAWLPPEIDRDGQKIRVEILGNWYGTKQAGKIWNDHFNEILISYGFKRCPVMPCLYVFESGTIDDINDPFVVMYLTIHVDDGLLVSSDLQASRDFMKAFLQKVRKAVMHEEVKLYLGMDIERVNGKYVIKQERYIESEFSAYHTNKLTPMSMNINLRLSVPNPANPSLLPDTGRFRYLADRTRPDILVSVGEVSTGGAEGPSDEHLLASKRIKNYLTTTKSIGITLGDDVKILTLFGYCDASYITTGNCKSRLGGCMFLGMNGGAIYSFSKNDTTISHSSTEAEIKAVDELCRQVVHVRELLEFMGYKFDAATTIYVDNKSAIELCSTLKMTHKTKHINMRINYIRELINKRMVSLSFIPTEYNVADVLTKPLAGKSHNRHCNVLMFGHNGELFKSDIAVHVLDSVQIN